MTIIKLVKPSYLAAASLFMNKDKTRPNLQTVFIEPISDGGLYLVAIDGHRMVVFFDREGHADKKYLVPVTRELYAATKFNLKHTDARLEVEDGILRVFNGHEPTPSYMQPFPHEDLLYPDWRRIVPLAKDPITSSVFNARYLGDFSKVLDAAFGDGKNGSIRIISHGKNPALVISSHNDFFGVVMPAKEKDSYPTSIPFDIEQEVFTS